MLKGGRRLGAANYLYVNGTSPHSLFCTVSQPSVCVCVCVCFSLHVYVIKERGRSFFFFFLKMTCATLILICSGEVFKLWKRCYYTLPQSRLRNVLFAMPGPDFADGN